MVKFFFETHGIKQAEYKTRAIGAASQDLTPAWEIILGQFLTIEKAVFSGQGRRGGGSWRKLTDEWSARKARLGLDPAINVATSALRDAMTIPDAPGQIVEMLPDRMIFGTDLPQAGPSQRERPFLDLRESDRFMMRETIKDYLMAAWRDA